LIPGKTRTADFMVVPGWKRESSADRRPGRDITI
jgi:hypothetical protein